MKELPKLQEEYEWLKEVDSCSLRCAIFNLEDAYKFFKIVQNKLHYAISGHTAAELIYSRSDSNKEHMGLTNWKNSPNGLIYKYDVSVAKNYSNSGGNHYI